MGVRAWWQWFQSLPWSRRWFAWLLLLRPLIDMSYEMKSISPFVSPLNIVAVLTPIAAIASLAARSMSVRLNTAADALMGLWGALLVLNAIAGLGFGITISSLEIGLRLTLPIFLFFYLRGFVQTKRDLVGVLTTFLHSTAFVFAMLLYERFVSPLREVVVTRGYERFEGLFADVNSYAFYIAGAFLIAAFFFLDNQSNAPLKKRVVRLAAIGTLSIMGLLSMHHAASWGVFAGILLLLIAHTAGRGQLQAAIVLLFLCVPAYFVVGDAVGERIESMYDRELAVIQGERDVEFAFHGRMQRWQKHVSEWQDMPAVAKLFGVALAVPPTSGKVGGGIHNDYLRVLFASGWVGLFVYLSFYVVLFARTMRMPIAERFLIRGGMAIVLLYSVTSGATTSIPVLYLVMAVFAYSLAPRLPQPGRRMVSAPVVGIPQRRLTTGAYVGSRRLSG